MAALEPDDPRSVGDYRLLSRLGAGGMGQVFLGRSPGGRLVAVKVIHAELVRRPEFRSRFRREVQAARLVSGAFTAPVIDADPDAPLPWLVTSYIAGPSLEQAVAEQGPMPTGQVLALAAGLAEALKSIHAANLVHRDLKPSNVLLAEDGPRVIDFGIVRSVEAESITRTGHTAGSPGFMSPEQVNGTDITPASDIFCLGAVLAFAATGGNPFGNGPTPALLYRVVHNEPDVEAVADPFLRSLISACLAKDPGLRPTPGDILSRVGPVGGEDESALPHAGQRPNAGQWPSAADPTVMSVTAPAADLDPAALGSPPSHDARPHPDTGFPTASFPHHVTGSQAAPHPPTKTYPTHPATRVDTHPATQMDTPQPPLSGNPSGPSVSGGPPSGPGKRGGRSRRAFLLSGAGAVAALGVGAGFWLNRTSADEEGADADRTGATGKAPAAARAQPVGVWPLDEPSGAVATDTVGGHNGTATDVRWRADNTGAAAFDGTRSQIVTAGPVLKTGAGRSFTVSAWVRLSSQPGSFATAVSQEATTDSGFYLQYSGDDKRWAFSRPGVRAVGYTVPAVNTWTHLVGVCDGPARMLRLYVDGVQEAAVDDTKPIAATGPLVIGRARYQGKPADFFPGAIKDVRVFDRALTAERVKNLR